MAIPVPTSKGYGQQSALDWEFLACKAKVEFPPGWNPNEYVFFSPRDNVHDVLTLVLRSASHSILANHYGYDDDEVHAILMLKAQDPNIAFMLNLDSSQAAGVHEKELVADYEQYVGTSVAIGQSAKHAISHLKVTVVDGLYVISGSTNLSLSGEEKQDNELRVTRDALMAARYSSIIMLNHAEMLKQASGKS